METKNYMFRNAQVGDRAFDILRGWGTIIAIKLNQEYPIYFNADIDSFCTFTLDGKRDKIDKNPTLFWNEVKLPTEEEDKKPFDLESELKKLEIVEFKDSESNFSLFWNHCCNDIVYFINRTVQIPSVLYFTEESINNFMKNIRNKKITKEQFFEAYKKVFS